MMIDWDERKEDLKHDSFLNSYFINKYEKAIDNIIIFEKQMLKECREEFADKVKEKLYELNGYVSAIEKTAIDVLLKEYEEE
jgi:hypothetical protein